VFVSTAGKRINDMPNDVARVRRKSKKPTLEDAGRNLLREDKKTLIRMMLEWAKVDERLHERLILYAARQAGPESSVAAVQKAFEKAVRVKDFADYRETRQWAHRVNEAIDSFELLLRDGHADFVVELCESALESLVASVEYVDDSDGHFSILRDRLEDIHYDACEEAEPEPVDLAKRLFEAELYSGLDVFDGAVRRYAEILGERGLKAYRELAQAEWAKVPARTPNQDAFESHGDFRITHIMKSLAQASGNVEELVAVMSRDLSSAYQYWQIAVVCRDAGQVDEALRWAELGLAAFSEKTDGRLREFAADEYHRRTRHDEAMKLMWAEFSERRSLERYKILEKHARIADAWPVWREGALAAIRLQIEEARESVRSQKKPAWMFVGLDHSLLVEIFLYEGRSEDAWREAEAGGCFDSLWLRLADAREKDHPEDAARVYLKHADAGIAAVRNARYEEPVKLLVKAAAVMKDLGRSADFVRHVEALSAKYKVKRNFIGLLEKKRKLLYLE